MDAGGVSCLKETSALLLNYLNRPTKNYYSFFFYCKIFTGNAYYSLEVLGPSLKTDNSRQANVKFHIEKIYLEFSVTISKDLRTAFMNI